MLQIEFHCHTFFSKDSLTSPDKILESCYKKGINRIVITDHNTIAGALQAHSLDPETVIIGEEIMTTKGEILAAFVQEEIPAGLDPFLVIKLLREQNAFISVAHPFDIWRSGHWGIDDLLQIIPFIDAIEIFNARCMLPKFNTQAQQFARENDLAGTVGSDAHTAFEVGKASMILPEFKTADDLRNVIRQTKYKTSLSAPWIHFTSRYAVWRKKYTNWENS